MYFKLGLDKQLRTHNSDILINKQTKLVTISPKKCKNLSHIIIMTYSLKRNLLPRPHNQKILIEFEKKKVFSLNGTNFLNKF